NARDGCDRTVESQFTQNREARQCVMWNGADRCHETECDRQIVMAAFFRQIGGCEVDGDASGRQCEAASNKCRAYALPGFGDSLIGKPYDRESRQTRCDLDLDVDRTRFDALKCNGGNPLNHTT